MMIVKRLLLLMILMMVGVTADAQAIKKPKLGEQPNGHLLPRQENSISEERLQLALEARVKVPFIDWGSWNYVTIHGTITDGVIEKVHPWDPTCKGFQTILRGKPRDIYLTCQTYCYYGLATPYKGHPLYIYDIRLTCDEFDRFESTYAPKIDPLRTF